ncbi:HEAT repeat domain-containing protein [Bradyrhizobium liaoningense]|uniref:HEAT repeat domain-containing protein n=1 Tax=Bradyrhizobium liaoningense TaxID=43992 RepID=UPI001BA7AC84|nr:HEAT repeat domain-containing protein [Bradyrhizobium liaoningense]MBR0901355.1 HEAT repeat domain-containing protein [Bradyrhizobium liaoningense]
MKAKDYREQVAAELGPATQTESAAAPAPVEPPVAAWRAALVSLASSSSSADTRKEALQLLQSGSFLEREFEPVRAEYVEALRRSASDPSEDVRRYALGILMGQKDDFARRKLVEGLQGTAAALLPPAAALSLLARDDHASVGAVANQILKSNTDPAVRMQAVRVLARDPSSVQGLEEILHNKDEFREVRRAGAVALKNLAPDRFAKSATTILNDQNEFPDIKSTVGGALELDGIVPNATRR